MKTNLKLVAEQAHKPRRAPAARKRPHWLVAHGPAIGVGAVYLACSTVSALDISEGIAASCRLPMYKAALLAGSIEFGQTALKAASLFAPEAARQRLSRWANSAIVGVMSVSALLNARALTLHAEPMSFDWLLGGALGIGLVFMIYACLQVLGHLVKR
jgi:hypothetical protein